MRISDAVARFYGQLTGQRVEQFPGEFGYGDSVWILSDPSADMRKQYPVEWCVLTEQGTRDDGSTWTLWDLLPDPAGEPWAWVTVLNTAHWSVLFVSTSHVELRSPEGAWSKHHKFAAAVEKVAQGKAMSKDDPESGALEQ